MANDVFRAVAHRPLWLVALTAPAAVFGPYWAALVSTLGVGGYLASKLNFNRRAPTLLIALVAPATALVLSQTRSLAAVITTETVLALLLAIISIHAGKLPHDGVPPTSGPASPRESGRSPGCCFCRSRLSSERSPACDGCDEYVRQISATIQALQAPELQFTPQPGRSVPHADRQSTHMTLPFDIQ